MTRRRLALSALAVVALGAAWGLHSDGLSAEERRLVGTWREAGHEDDDPGRIEFATDRRVWWRSRGPDGREMGRWSVRGREVLIDAEPSSVRPGLRPVAPLLGMRVGPTEVYSFEWSAAGDLTFGRRDGPGTIYTRAPTD